MLLFLFLLSTVAEGVNVKESNFKESGEAGRRAREAPNGLTDVVNLAFCDSSLSEEEKSNIVRLEKVHTYAELKQDPRASLPDTFTICSTMMTTNCPNYVWPVFFTILDNNRAQFFAPISSHSSVVSLVKIYYLQGASEGVNGKIPPLFPSQWIRSCLAINTTSGLINWVVEGTHVLTTTSEEVKNSKSQPRDLSRKLVLGARSYVAGWKASSSKVTNLNIFSSTLSMQKMKSMTGGKSCLEEGDYLAWKDMEWILHGQGKMETVNQEEPCKEKPFVDVFHTKFPDMNACVHHCQNLGTRVPSVTTLQDWATLQQSLKMQFDNDILNTMELWLPVGDKKTEGEWRDFYTGRVLQNYTQPWAGAGPDGGMRQNCAYLLGGNTWGDINCDSPNQACMCKHNPRSYLVLKGICRGTSIDRYYRLISDFTDSRKLKLQGLEGTSITYDNREKIWILDMRDSNLSGIAKASHSSFTLGKHNWTIQGDKGCNGGQPYVRELKMSGCQEGSFTCNDGQCVSMDQRCNQLPDCRDESDERNCQILLLKDGYNMEVPPIDLSDPNVNVSVSIDLLRLVDINEEDYSIAIQFEIIMIWKEKRAKYQNLKKRDSLNALTKKDIAHLWLPKVIYENTDQKETTRVGSDWEWETKVLVRREQQKGTMSGPESADETEIFRGFENSLVMHQTYTHTFQCNYQLSRYPFDTQVNVILQVPAQDIFQICNIDMAMGSLDITTVTLIPYQLIMTQGKDMPIFYITDWNFSSKTFQKGKNGLRLVIIMKRKITSEMMTTYFPSLLLTAITFATTFFKPFFFEAALSVNLTTMLVMTTIFISKMEGLPPTSDIKMIDIWLILCQMVPFAEVVLLTAMEYNREDKEIGEEKKRLEIEGEKTKNLQTTSLIVAPMDKNVCNDEIKTGTLNSNCGNIIPSLKIVGKFVFNFETNKTIFSFQLSRTAL